MSFRLKINGEWCEDWEPIQAHIMDMEKKIEKQAAEIKQMKRTNNVLVACIEDVLIRAADYDGYHTVRGLKYLVDVMIDTLKNKRPERICSEIGIECCALCLKPLTEKAGE